MVSLTGRIQAHDHARAASNATQQAESTVAISEHALAAGEFANAAKSTTSIEALRTLRLLEEHHQRLSELLRLPLEQKLRPSELAELDEKETTDTVQPALEAEHTKTEQTVVSAGAKPGAVPSLAQPKRYPNRPPTSSIASNLASARGIKSRSRGQSVPPSVTSDQAPGTLEVSPRREHSESRSKMQNVLDQSTRPGWVPPRGSSPPSEAPKNRELPTVPETAGSTSQSQPSDDNYSRFYSTFSGLMNRLSAPLAFAGLPLVAEESAVQEAQERRDASPNARRSRHKAPASQAEPDLSKIYSRATMRAISGKNPNESFYVVPTTGHTMSYANILNYADKEKRRLEASLHAGGEASLLEDNEDDFVDARESPVQPPSPTRRRRPGGPSSGIGGVVGGGSKSTRLAGPAASSKTAEELAVENKSLKEVLDKLSRRLHAFEASAQNSHFVLAESMRLARPGSPLTSSGGAAPAVPASSDDAATLRTKNQELEQQVVLAAQRMESMERDHQKLERSLAKYRERWDKLKAGAKARRGGQGGSVENSAAAVEEEPGPA